MNDSFFTQIINLRRAWLEVEIVHSLVVTTRRLSHFVGESDTENSTSMTTFFSLNELQLSRRLSHKLNSSQVWVPSLQEDHKQLFFYNNSIFNSFLKPFLMHKHILCNNGSYLLWTVCSASRHMNCCCSSFTFYLFYFF